MVIASSLADAAITFAVDAAFSLVGEAKTAELLPPVFSSCTDPRSPATAEDVAVSWDSACDDDEAFREGVVDTAWLGAEVVADFSIVNWEALEDWVGRSVADKGSAEEDAERAWVGAAEAVDFPTEDCGDSVDRSASEEARNRGLPIEATCEAA